MTDQVASSGISRGGDWLRRKREEDRKKIDFINPELKTLINGKVTEERLLQSLGGGFNKYNENSETLMSSRVNDYSERRNRERAEINARSAAGEYFVVSGETDSTDYRNVSTANERVENLNKLREAQITKRNESVDSQKSERARLAGISTDDAAESRALADDDEKRKKARLLGNTLIGGNKDLIGGARTLIGQ